MEWGKRAFTATNPRPCVPYLFTDGLKSNWINAFLIVEIVSPSVLPCFANLEHLINTFIRLIKNLKSSKTDQAPAFF